MIVRILLALAFFAIVGTWSAGKLLSDGAAAGNAAASPPAAAAAAPAAASATSVATDVSATTPPAAAANDAAAPTAAVTATNPATPNTPQPVPPTAAPSKADTGADEIAQQQALERLGKTYLLAIQADDANALRGMLAARCMNTDVRALLARRGTEITSAAGVGVEEITALNQYVGHIDVGAGEAHTVLQFIARGQPGQLYTADGWLLENGTWRSANC